MYFVELKTNTNQRKLHNLIWLNLKRLMRLELKKCTMSTLSVLILSLLGVTSQTYNNPCHPHICTPLASTNILKTYIFFSELVII